MELKLALATIALRCRLSHRHHEVWIDGGSTVNPAEQIEVDMVMQSEARCAAPTRCHRDAVRFSPV